MWKTIQDIQLSPRDRRLREALVFLLRLLVLAGPLYFVLLFVDLQPLQFLVASHSSFLLRGIGFEVLQEGALLEADGFRFAISQDSTGWKSMVFLGALILAVPGVLWRKRFWGLAIGIPIIYFGNLFRVLSIVLAEQAYGLQAAMLVHDVGWRFGLVGLVLGIWLVWHGLSKK